MSGRTAQPTALELEDWLVLPALGLLPWAFGGVEIWAFRSAALLVVAAVCVVLWKRGPGGLGIGRDGERWQLAALVLAAWAMAQVLPLPAPLIRLVSPNAHRVYAETFPGYPESPPTRTLTELERQALERSEVPGPETELPARRDDFACGGTWRLLSLHPSATVESLFWYVALLGAFLVVRGRGARRRTARVYRFALFASFAGLAVFGLVQRLTWNGNLYWIRPLLVDSNPFGPYVNPSHFAGVMELAVPWLAGYTWSRFERSRQGHESARFRLTGAAAIVCLVAGLATASKMAAVLLPASLIALVLLGARTRRARVRLGLVAAILTAGLALALAGTTVGQRIRSYVDRVEGLDVAGGRVSGWIASSSIVADYPLTGVGFGAFSEVYPRYTPPGEFKRWSQLHNDYLEVLVDGGLLAAVPLLLLVWGYGSRLFGELSRERPLVSRNRLGLAIGLLALSAHAIVDFNHQIPANALLFVALAALALPLPEAPSRLSGSAVGRHRRWILPVAAALLITYTDRAWTGIVSGVAFARAAVLTEAGATDESQPFLEIAARGGNKLRATRELAETRIEAWDEHVRRDGYDRAGTAPLDRSARDYAVCACLSPAGWRPFEGLARVYHRREMARRSAAPDGGVEPLGVDGRVAIGMQRIAIDRAPNWYVPYDRLAMMLRDYGLERETLDAVRESAALLPLFPRDLYPDDGSLPPALLDAFAEGAWQGISGPRRLDRAAYRISLARLELQRGGYQRAIELLRSVFDHTHDDMQRAESDLLLGEAYLSLGQHEPARQHLEAAARNDVVEAPALDLLARVERDLGRTEEELAILNRLRSLRPHDFDLCLAVAAAASRLGRWSAAEISLQSAEELNSADPRPPIALVELHIEQGSLDRARHELSRVESRFGRTEAVQRLHDRLEAAGR